MNVDDRKHISACPARAAARSARPGFTLLEIVLALSLVLVLTGLAIVSYTDWFRGEALEEGTSRVMTAVMMARAEAASEGKRVRLEVVDGGLQASWESDPLKAPGAFVPLDAPWVRTLPNDLVAVVRLDVTAPAAYRPPPSSQQDAPQQYIMFYPGGTSDSAAIELRDAHQDGPHTVLEVDGINGVIVRKIVDQGDMEEYHRQLDEKLAGKE